MKLDFMFFFNSILLGVGLAMDAFSVSLANGLNEPKMPRRKIGLVAFVFAFFQALMPLIGWVCVHEFVERFRQFEKFIPYVALILLCYIGGSMLLSAAKNKDEQQSKPKVGFISLLVQGVATSIDALSVGFTIAEYDVYMALLSASIIALVTFVISFLGVILGKRFGTMLKNKAEVLGGMILIVIGIEIFITGIV